MLSISLSIWPPNAGGGATIETFNLLWNGSRIVWNGNLLTWNPA